MAVEPAPIPTIKPGGSSWSQVAAKQVVPEGPEKKVPVMASVTKTAVPKQPVPSTKSSFKKVSVKPPPPTDTKAATTTLKRLAQSIPAAVTVKKKTSQTPGGHAFKQAQVSPVVQATPKATIMMEEHVVEWK